MKKVIISSSYGEYFIKNKLPLVFAKLLNERLHKKNIQNIFTYITDNYKISKETLISNILKSIKVSKYDKTKYILYFDNNIYIDDVNLENLVSLITYGNREIRGSNVILDAMTYLKKNLSSIYKLYILRKESGLWV